MIFDNLLKKRDVIYGVCAVWIVLFHVFRNIGMPYIPVITHVICMGNMAVDTFLLLSGLCLALSAERNRYAERGWKDYFRRRFTRILIPYLLIAVPYYLWNAAVEQHGSILRRAAMFAGNLSSATFWGKGTQTTWYVYAILVFYLLFPFIFRFTGKSWKRGVVLIAAAVGFAAASSCVPVLRNSTIVWARLPIFIAGVLVGQHRGKTDRPILRSPALKAVCLCLAAALFAWMSADELSEKSRLPDAVQWLLYAPLTILLLCGIPVSARKPGSHNLIAVLGTVSLEIYLIHITLLHPLKRYGVAAHLGNWLYLYLPLVSAAAAYLLSLLVQRIIDRTRARHGRTNA